MADGECREYGKRDRVGLFLQVRELLLEVTGIVVRPGVVATLRLGQFFAPHATEPAASTSHGPPFMAKVGQKSDEPQEDCINVRT